MKQQWQLSILVSVGILASPCMAMEQTPRAAAAAGLAELALGQDGDEEGRAEQIEVVRTGLTALLGLSPRAQEEVIKGHPHFRQLVERVAENRRLQALEEEDGYTSDASDTQVSGRSTLSPTPRMDATPLSTSPAESAAAILSRSRIYPHNNTGLMWPHFPGNCEYDELAFRGSEWASAQLHSVHDCP